MTIRPRFGICLVALLAAWPLAATATELPVPSVHKVVTAARYASKPAPRHRLIRIASAQWPPSSSCALACSMPLILGIGF